MKRDRRRITVQISVLIVVLVALLVVLMGGRNSDSVSAVAVPELTDPNASGRMLVERWLAALESGQNIDDLIADNYQIQRADGSGSDRVGYLKNPAIVEKFDVVAVEGLQAGRTFSVRWSVNVSEWIDNVWYGEVKADRLTVFEWIDRDWKIVGYGNFNPIAVSGNLPTKDQAPSSVTGSTVPTTSTITAPPTFGELNPEKVPVDQPVVTFPPINDGGPSNWSSLRPATRVPSTTNPSLSTTTLSTTPKSPTTTKPTCKFPGNSGKTPATNAPGHPCNRDKHRDDDKHDGDDEHDGDDD